jgi:RNA-directed DNA polymerase
MDLAKLLFTLKPLLADARSNLPKIVELLEKHNDLAEYAVARFYVSKAAKVALEDRLSSVDPAQRAEAVKAIPKLLGRNEGATLLRRVYKDPAPAVRSAARSGVYALGIEDVALPDSRFPAPRNNWQREGGWNETGWAFGLSAPRARKPTRRVPEEIAATRGVFKELQTTDDVAKKLGFKKGKELKALMRAGSQAGSGYVEFTVPKATGGVRTICAPRAPLKRVQRSILRELLGKVPAHPAAHGFINGRSVVSNAQPHEGAKVVIKIDLKDFFPTVHFYRVAGTFRYLGMGEAAANTLAAIVTHRNKLPDGTVIMPGALPQGAPTSPAITNIVCRRLDARLDALAKKADATYTRYADDLTFSFRAEPSKGVGRFLWWVDQVIQQEGFVQNAPKRRVLRPSNQQRITGVVVNNGLSVPRDARRRFRAILENVRRTSLEEQSRGKRDFKSYLTGFASYVKMVQPEVGNKLLAEVRSVLAEDARKKGTEK